MDKKKLPADWSQSEKSTESLHASDQGNRMTDLRLWMTTQESAEYSGYDTQDVGYQYAHTTSTHYGTNSGSR